MPKHHVERLSPYTVEQLFTLVADVERYPEFVPWIMSMSVGSAREEKPGVDILDAEASVRFSFLSERFATWVRRDAVAQSVEVGLIRGPFRRLSNQWRFESTDDPARTRIVFDIDFAFKSRVLDMLLVANFDRAVGRLIACFENRAAQVYGAPTKLCDASLM